MTEWLSFHFTQPFNAMWLQSCLTFATLWTIDSQAPLFMGFSRQEYWSGFSFPSPRDLPNPRIKPLSPASPASAGGFFTTETPGKPLISSHWVLILAYHLFPSNLPIYWHSLCLNILVCGMDRMILPILNFNERIKQENPYSKTQNSDSCRVNAETMFTLLIIKCRNLRK